MKVRVFEEKQAKEQRVRDVTDRWKSGELTSEQARAEMAALGKRVL